MDIEQAYRVLELRPGASFKEVVEARDDLFELWNPDRLSHHPRLRSRSTAKREEIQQAYELVMESLTAAAPGVSAAAGRQPRAPSASLFEEVFQSEAKSRKKLTAAIWILSAALAGAILLALYLAQTGVPDSNAPAQAAPQPAEAAASPVPDSEQQVPASEAQTAPPAQAVPASPSGDSALPAKPTVHPQREPSGSSPQASPRRGNAPVLLRREIPENGGKAARERSAEWVYEELLKRSPSAQRLAEGRFEDLRLLDWKIVQSNPPEYWMQLTARRSDGQSVDFLWSVDSRESKAVPRNEQARLLESR